MPEQIRELHDSRIHTVDGDAVRGTRTFHANYPVDQAVTSPGVPAMYSIFLFGTHALTLRSIDARPMPENPSWTELVCNYNSGTPGILQTDTNYNAFELSSVRTILEIPGFRSLLVIEAAAADGTPIHKIRYDPFTLKFDSYELNLQVRMNLTSMPSGYGTYIASQTGKLHRFFGLWWRFMGATAGNEEKNRWAITYNWVHDPGNAAPDAEALAGDFGEYIKIPSVKRGSFETYVTAVRPSTVGQGDLIPVFGVMKRMNVDENGWRELPGRPLG